MSNDAIVLPPDGSGKALDVESVANGGSGGATTVYRHRNQIAGAALAAIAAVQNSAPSTEYGLVTRNIPSGTQPVSGTFWQATQPVSVADIAVPSSTITTQNLVPAGTATAGSALLSGNLNNVATASIQVTGTYTGALSVQATVDNATWVTLGGTPLVNVNTGAQTATIPSAAAGIWQIDVAGYKQIRLTALAAVTGTATVSMQLTNAAALIAVNTALPAGTNALGTVTVAQLPAAAALADGTTNPTTGIVGALAEVYNGSTWDRRKSASAANLSAASGTGAALVSPPGAWTVTHNPAAATQATATKAAGGAGVRHVCTGICAAIAASGTASGTVTVVLRDGATGVGGLLYVQTLSVPVNSSASINFPCPPIYGTANAAMTLEFTAGGAAATFETITLMGYDAS